MIPGRTQKIQALKAFAKGDTYLLRSLLDSVEKPLFVTAVACGNTFYLDQDDLVMTRDEFESYINGRQPIFPEVRPWAGREFKNKYLPTHLKFENQENE